MSASVLNPESSEPMMEINTTPLIDVMLVLLIMIIMTIPIQSHAVKLDLPQNSNSTAACCNKEGCCEPGAMNCCKKKTKKGKNAHSCCKKGNGASCCCSADSCTMPNKPANVNTH